jgi:molybdate transport system ATP-binding protein
VLELDRLTVRWQGRHSEFRARLPDEAESFLPVPARVLPPPVEPIIEMHGVNVRYGDRPILRDVSWTVRAGERWAVLGPNGSGKSILLSLICGDHPQAYSNEIRLFGRPRGTGESIWEIKRHLGLVSPELHLYFSEPLTAAQTAATGFFDVVTYRPTTQEQDRTVFQLFEQFEIAALAERPFAHLSTGEQRLVLLIRALVKDPPLLVLDEPFQALDGGLMSKARHWLDDHLSPDQTLVFVSHYRKEIPQTVHRFLHLDSGRVVETR